MYMSMLSVLLKNKMMEKIMNKGKTAKNKKKKSFKVSYIALLGFLLSTIIFTASGVPLWLSVVLSGVFGTLAGATVGMVIKGGLFLGNTISKIFNGIKRKEFTEKKSKKEVTKESKLGVVKEKTSSLWQSVKEKVEAVNLARQEKKKAKLEEQKRKEEKQKEDYEEYQKLEEKPSLKERLFSKFHRKEKKNSSKVKSTLTLNDDEELEEGKDEQLDSSIQDENQDLEATPKKSQEDNPLFTHRLKRSELRRPKYVIFEEIYKQPSETITTSTGRLSVNTEQFLKDAKKQLDVLNEQLVRTQNEILQLEKQIGDIYNAPTKKMAR